MGKRTGTPRSELEVMKKIERSLRQQPSMTAMRVADWVYARWGTGMVTAHKAAFAEQAKVPPLAPPAFETEFARWITSNVLTAGPYDMQALEDLCGAGPLTDFVRAYTYEALIHMLGRPHDPDEEACLRLFYDDLRQHLGLAFNPPDQE